MVRKATQKAPSQKQAADVWAPPSFWSPWYPLEEIWTRADMEAYVSVTFESLSNVPTTFDVELAHGQNKSPLGRAIGPGSTTVRLPRNVVTTLYMRAKAHGVFGQILDVTVSRAPTPPRTKDTHYIWRTKRDNKVRPSHAANEGKVFSWDNPPPTGHPRDDYNCRCVTEPYKPEKL